MLARFHQGENEIAINVAKVAYVRGTGAGGSVIYFSNNDTLSIAEDYETTCQRINNALAMTHR